MILKYLQEKSTEFWLANAKSIYHNSSVHNKGERKQKRKSGIARGGWKKGDKKGGRGIWIKKLIKKKEKEEKGKKVGQRTEFTLGSLAAPYLPASSQIHWHLPYVTDSFSSPTKAADY